MPSDSVIESLGGLAKSGHIRSSELFGEVGLAFSGGIGEEGGDHAGDIDHGQVGGLGSVACKGLQHPTSDLGQLETAYDDAAADVSFRRRESRVHN